MCITTNSQVARQLHRYWVHNVYKRLEGKMSKELEEMVEACKNAQDSLDKLTSMALSQGDFLKGNAEDVFERLLKYEREL